LRLGILGGTFDPIHIGHLILGEAAREGLALDRVLFVPTGVQWRKPGREIAPPEHRVAMTRLAIDDNPAFEMSTLEVDRPGPSYTVDTLEALMIERPGSELVLILGHDAYSDLPNWVRPERITELARVVVAARGGQTHGTDAGPPAAGQRMPVVDISATDIRERVAGGRSTRYLVPAAVEAYIHEHGLYRR
jgi:nicotinate-nucleotide adenylyltransferase